MLDTVQKIFIFDMLKYIHKARRISKSYDVVKKMFVTIADALSHKDTRAGNERRIYTALLYARYIFNAILQLYFMQLHLLHVCITYIVQTNTLEFIIT